MIRQQPLNMVVLLHCSCARAVLFCQTFIQNDDNNSHKTLHVLWSYAVNRALKDKFPADCIGEFACSDANRLFYMFQAKHMSVVECKRA